MDPYFPGNSERPRALPTGQEWNFRVKYLSQPNSSEVMMKEAMQGLVQICFPSGVLDELGIDIIKGHMREEGASSERIAQAQELYEHEMVHRLSWMLAEYVNTSEKAEIALASLIAANHRLHGSKFDYEVLSDITAGFERLRDQHAGATDHLKNGARITVPQRSKPSHECPPKGEETSGSCNTGALTDENLENDRAEDYTERPRWYFELDEALPTNSITEHFQKTYDLFAFHAIPVARRELGTGASINAISSLAKGYWQKTQAGERKEWKKCYKDLVEGDLEVLKRPGADDVNIGVVTSVEDVPGQQTTKIPEKLRRRTRRDSFSGETETFQEASPIRLSSTPVKTKDEIEADNSAHPGPPCGKKTWSKQNGNISSLSNSPTAVNQNEVRIHKDIFLSRTNSEHLLIVRRFGHALYLIFYGVIPCSPLMIKTGWLVN